MTKEVIHVPVLSDVLEQTGIPLSPAIRAGGFIFISGTPPVDPRTGALVPGDVAAQTEACLECLKVTLEAAGSSLDKVVKVIVYASNSAYYGTINKIYGRYFSKQPPARTFVTVGSWPMEFDLGIERIAVR
jgi:reactive intermediate/imine deaminase